MNLKRVKIFFSDKENALCPLTEKLVKAGYQQISGGYIDRAKRMGILVDYKTNIPSQYWHLMSYCDSSNPEKSFNKSIVCGELIFWMAEVSCAVEPKELEKLANQIIESVDSSKCTRPLYDRKRWNREIQNLCFDRIAEVIDGVSNIYVL